MAELQIKENFEAPPRGLFAQTYPFLTCFWNNHAKLTFNYKNNTTLYRRAKIYRWRNYYFKQDTFRKAQKWQHTNIDKKTKLFQHR